MSHPPVRHPATQPRRTAALVLGYIALVALGLIWTVFLLIAGFTEGSTSMAAVAPMLAYMLTGWLWAVLAVTALILGAGVERRRHPLIIAGIALALAFLGLLVLLPR